MPMSDEDFKILRDHVQSHAQGGTMKPCPICGTDLWVADGPMALIRTKETETESTTGSSAIVTFPVATLTCTKCFYMQTFVWSPIESAAKKNG
jgi:hypothetical protein